MTFHWDIYLFFLILGVEIYLPGNSFIPKSLKLNFWLILPPSGGDASFSSKYNYFALSKNHI